MIEIESNARKLIDQLLSSRDGMGVSEVKGTLFECSEGRINLFAHVEKNNVTGSDSIMGEVILGGKENTHIVGYKDFGWYSTLHEAVRAILGNVDLLLKKQKSNHIRMKTLGFEAICWGLYHYGEFTISVNPYGCVIKIQDDSFLGDTLDPVRAFKMYMEYSIDNLSKIPKELIDRLVRGDEILFHGTSQNSLHSF